MFPVYPRHVAADRVYTTRHYFGTGLHFAVVGWLRLERLTTVVRLLNR
jgi:hypothetical protein